MYTVITGIPVNFIYVNTEQQRKYCDLPVVRMYYILIDAFFDIITIKKKLKYICINIFQQTCLNFCIYFMVSFDAIVL